MKDRSRILWFFWPSAILTVSIAVYLFPELAFQQLASDPDPNAIQRLSAAVAFYSCAWLLARIFGAALKKSGRRKVPRLLRELIAAALFLVATIATVAMLLGQSAGGALASSGLVIAIFGFAIRNVLADVLSGIALGLEAPFRIGDWIEINGDIRGCVIEIGWRTTRLRTRNDIYMIFPNSQISRQKLTNYSAPRKHYRASLEIALGHDVPVREGKKMLAAAAASTENIMETPKPDVRVLSYGKDEVRYAIRYWVPSFVDDIDCRDAILVAVDAAIRERDDAPQPIRRMKLVPTDEKLVAAGS